jgi:hypothetical protein
MATKRVTRSQSHRLSAASSTTLSDLGPELLNAVFCQLAPSPMHLAAVSCVCKDWRNVMREETWKQLCLAAAPALCKSMGFNERGPPGGWLGIYKLLVYCPGLHPSDYRGVVDTVGRDDGPNGWWELLGHVQTSGCGFQTGPAVIKDLRMREPFRKDV